MTTQHLVRDDGESAIFSSIFDGKGPDPLDATKNYLTSNGGINLTHAVIMLVMVLGIIYFSTKIIAHVIRTLRKRRIRHDYHSHPIHHKE